MYNKRMEKWDAGEFGRTFLHAAEISEVEPFRRSFSALGRAAAALDGEFCRQTADCGSRLSAAMRELQSIGGRMGYCERPRGFEGDCADLYGEVERAVTHMEALREQCFV